MACAEPRLTALKVAHKDEIHRLRVDLSTFQFAELSALVAETFTLAPGAFVLQYTDNDGDVLNVTSQAEYVEACRVFLAEADTVASLRFTAVARTQVVFQEQVAEPILKAIEKLVETLTAAMEKVKREQWAQRAQSGVETTGEALNRAAKDARESLYTAGQTIKEIPFDQVLKETSDGLKTAADGITSFAHDLVEEMKKLQVAGATPYPAMDTATTTSTDTPAPVEVAEATPVVTETAPVQPAEAEWEQVEEQASVEVVAPAAPLEEAPVVVVAEPAVVSAEERKWAAELAMIGDIVPGLDTKMVIDRLEQCNGNVQVVVNAIMEEM